MFLAPSQVLKNAVASPGVKQVEFVVVQVADVMVGSSAGLYVHLRGSVSKPSWTPSSMSQAAIAALVARACFAFRIAVV